MTDRETALQIDATRISALRDALVLASEGAFDVACARIDNASNDAFGEVEALARDLIRDFEISIQQTRISIDEFKASKASLQKQLDTIKQQQMEIQSLSAPIIDVGDDVVAVPLTGVIDGIRMQGLSERVLARISASRTRWVILDLTGIELLDSHLVDRLVRLAAAVRLLGAGCLMTGMSPRVALTLVSLGVGLEGFVALRSLKDGLAYCRSQAEHAASTASARLDSSDSVR